MKKQTFKANKALLAGKKTDKQKNNATFAIIKPKTGLYSVHKT